MDLKLLSTPSSHLGPPRSDSPWLLRRGRFSRRGPALAGLAAAIFLAGGAAAAEWTWRTAPDAPDQRSEVSVAGDGTALYLAGGLAAGPSAPSTAYRFDPASGRWTDLPALPHGLHHAGLAVLDDRLYLVGGYRDASWTPLASLWILDLGAQGGWEAGPPMPTARGGLAVAVLNGRIHAVGGQDGSRSLGTHEVFDPAGQRWEAAAPLAVPRNHHTAAALGNRLFVFGGRDEATAEMTATEVYDPAADRWTAAAPMPTGRSGIAAAVVDGKAVVLGGETFGAGERTFPEAELYDPASDQWTPLPPMPEGRHGLGAATLEGVIHVVAGGPKAGLSFSATHRELIPAETGASGAQ